VILGNRVGCLFRELREDSSASLVSAGGANRGNLRGLVRFFLSVYLARARSFIQVYASVRLASLPRGSLHAFVCVAAYVRLRRDMATAREAKHINCRLTPQKQHDLIPRRICKRLSHICTRARARACSCDVRARARACGVCVYMYIYSNLIQERLHALERKKIKEKEKMKNPVYLYIYILSRKNDRT